MQEEHVDLVAGDFNGAAWRQSNCNNPQPTSILEGSICRHRLSDAAWPHTVVGPRCSARQMDRCVWFCQLLPELGRCMEDSATRGLYNPSRNPWLSSKRSELPLRSMAAFGPCQQSICSRVTRKSRSTCPPHGKVLLLPAYQRKR